MDLRIEELINSIEREKLSDLDREKKIQELVYLWKFSDSFIEDTKITDDFSLAINNSQNRKVIFYDLDLTTKEKSDILKNSCSLARSLSQDIPRQGLYYFLLHKQSHNFNSLSVQSLQNELHSCINGEMVPYQYVKKIIKIPQESAEISIDNIVKECKKEDVVRAINTVSGSESSTDKWLVLLLDSLQSQCDSFYIEDAIINHVFSCEFEKVFLFDYYKCEVIELNTQPF